MRIYKPKDKTTLHFAIMLNNSRDRRQKVVNTYATDKRIAAEVMRKTQLLAEAVAANMALSLELRQWLDNMNPKLRRRLQKLGLLTLADSSSAQALDEHIDDYLADCRFRGLSEAYEKIKRSQLKRIVLLAKAQRLSDLTIESVTTALQQLKVEDRSARTINQNRATVVAFLNWCVMRDRLDSHRVDRVPRLNEDDDRRLERRAATDEEIRRLLATAPPHRRMVYEAAILTGLRRNEITQIEARDIDIIGGTLTVRAAVAKKKKGDVIPLHQDLVPALSRRLLRLRPNDKVFAPVPRMETYKKDLAKAGIPFVDVNGEQLDFHALRGTFATRLLRGGVPLSVAKQLTRHASAKTLERHYDKLGLSDAAAAMKRLPGLNPHTSDGSDPPTKA